MPVEAMIVIGLICGAWRGSELADARLRPELARLYLQPATDARLYAIGVVAVLAIVQATSWRQGVYAFLLPIGAYYVARSIAEPLFRLSRLRQLARDQSGSKPMS